MKYRIIFTAGIVVGVLWLVVLGAIHFLHEIQPTAASTLSWIQHQPDWSTLSADERARRIDALADQMNQLSFSERQKLHGEQGMGPLMKQMTEEERLSLLDKTLPRGFEQMMDAINKMKPEDRRAMVDKAVENMKKMDPERMANTPPEVKAAMDKVVQVGFSSYLTNASAQTKLDMAPLIEQIQINMQGGGGGGGGREGQ